MCVCIVGSAQCSGCVVYCPSAMVAISLLSLQAVDEARRECEGLRLALEQEMKRRRDCEENVAKRETELAQALKRLGEFERVSCGGLKLFPHFYIFSLCLSFSVTIAEPQSVPIKKCCCHLKNFLVGKKCCFCYF